MSDTERLRDAATRLRAVAEDATPGPWEVIGGGEYLQGPGILVGEGIGSITATNVDYIAMMHPPVALALADLLDSLAFDREVEVDGRTWREVLTVADVVLGGEQT